jgi:hypothetical protein
MNRITTMISLTLLAESSSLTPEDAAKNDAIGFCHFAEFEPAFPISVFLEAETGKNAAELTTGPLIMDSVTTILMPMAHAVGDDRHC